MLAAFLAACSHVRDSKHVEVAPGTEMGRYQVFGVLPFGDNGGGKGRAMAQDVGKALKDKGLQVVEMDVMEKEYRKTKGDTFGMTLFGMNTLRSRTKAEVLVTGSITEKSYSLYVQELESGDMLIDVKAQRRVGEIPRAEVLESMMKYLTGEGATTALGAPADEPGITP